MGDTIQLILFGVFAGVIGIQVLYWIFVHGKMVIHKHLPEVKEPEKPVSLIIAARNEEENLKRLIPALLSQKFVEFEIVIVDDCSLDDTYLVMRDFSQTHKNIKISRIQESANFTGGKKAAVTIGIKAAQHEHLVFTDADCVPSSDFWLRDMAIALEQRQIAIGYAPLKKTTGLLNKLIRYDVFYNGMQYLGFAKLGMPYMGVGRNMGYRSHLFFEQKGFASHYDIASGDDDLMVNAVATRKNTKVVFHKEAFCYSEAKSSLSDWVKQKTRHLSTSPKYKISHLLTLGIVSISQYATFGLLIVQLVLNVWVLESLILFASRYLIQQVVSFLNLRKTNETDLMLVSLFGEVFYLFFYPVLMVRQSIAKTNAWKR